MKMLSVHSMAIVLGLFVPIGSAAAQSTAGIPPSLVTPDKVKTRIGNLEFKDGAPDKATVEKVYDEIDFTHAYDAFVNTMEGVSLVAARKGFLDAGVKDNEILIFSELMDAKSLFLTANADTVYFFGFIDLSKGPMVFEVSPKVLGAFDDMWFRWVTDFGLPGPDRGLGGKYLILPPQYDGPVPEGGYFVSRSRTTRVLILGRAFLENKNDPKPAVESIRSLTKIYPFEAGGVGTSIAEFLAGKARLGRVTPPSPTVFHEGSGKVMNTVPPNDWSFYEMANEIVQEEPATSLDPELMGSLAAIGIVKGKPFAPDARMTGIGSQYLIAMLDADKNYFDGAKTYKCTLPKGIPESNFWSFTLYDNQSRSMLDTPQRYPRAGSQSYPSPAAEASADGSTILYQGLETQRN